MWSPYPRTSCQIPFSLLLFLLKLHATKIFNLIWVYVGEDMESSDLVEVLVDLIWFPMGRGIQEKFLFGRGFDKIWFELIELMQDMVLEVTLFALVFLCNISWDYQKINRIPKREDVTRKNKGRRWGEPTNSTIIVEKKFLIGWWATSRVSRTRTIQSTRDRSC